MSNTTQTSNIQPGHLYRNNQGVVVLCRGISDNLVHWITAEATKTLNGRELGVMTVDQFQNQFTYQETRKAA